MCLKIKVGKDICPVGKLPFGMDMVFGWVRHRIFFPGALFSLVFWDEGFDLHSIESLPGLHISIQGPNTGPLPYGDCGTEVPVETPKSFGIACHYGEHPPSYPYFTGTFVMFFLNTLYLKLACPRSGF